MKNINQEALKLHETNHGKLGTYSKVEINNQYDLSLAYSPGVAEPCKMIAKNPSDVYKYTNKSNTVAIITDGSAVLGLGNIGALSSIPVMEGKAILMKRFAGLDAYPICLSTQNTEEIINIVKNIGATFGGINLEDISAPRCIEIEQRLQAIMDIPVFHDDQHGTAIVASAALINACKVTNKKISELIVAQSGTGAAGLSIIKMFKKLGVKTVRAYNINGVVNETTRLKNDQYVNQMLDTHQIDNSNSSNTLADIIKGADVFLGVSVPNIVTVDMIKTMNRDPIIFALANPNPEIMPDLAKAAGAAVVGTGRSDFPNQINNLLAFPGIFKGALSIRAPKITREMMMAAAYAIASTIPDNELTNDNIIPNPFTPKIADKVAAAVVMAANH